jgi:anti-sigma B factor antagonist
MELAHRQENGIDIFSVTGRVDLAGVAEFQNNVAQAIAGGARKVVMDLSGTTYISSSGLGVFALALKQLQPLGGEMVLAGANSHVRHILQIVGFEKLFRTFNDTNEAAAALQSKT